MRDPSFSVIDALTQMGAASNSNAALMAVLGARGAEFIPLVRELAQNHNLVAESAQRVGALLPSEIADLELYRGTIETAATQFDNFKARVLGAAIPAFEAVTSGFGDMAAGTGRSSDSMDTVWAVILGLGDTFIVLRAAVQDITDYIVASLTLWKDAFESVGEAAWDALHGHFGAAASDVKSGFESVKGNLSALLTSWTDNANEASASFEKLKIAASGLDTVQVTATKIGGTNPLADLSGSDAKAQEDAARAMQATWSAAWTVIKKMTEASDTLKEMSAEAQAEAKSELDSQLGSLTSQETAIKEAYRNRQISAQREYQQTVALIQQELAARVAYYEQLAQLAAGDAAKLAQIDGQIAQSTQKYLQQMQAAHATYTSNVSKAWQNVATSMSSSMGRTFASILSGTETLGQGMRNMFMQIGESILKTFVQIEVQKAVMTALGIQQNAAHGKSEAATAAAAAAKSAASIQIVGWILAPLAAATVYAAAAGYSAEGGFDVPAGHQSGNAAAPTRNGAPGEPRRHGSRAGRERRLGGR